LSLSLLFFFFTDTAPTEIYTLSLHDALPILPSASPPPRSRVIAILSSSPRGRGSRASQDAAPLPWAPAFAGMTGRKWGHGRRQQERLGYSSFSGSKPQSSARSRHVGLLSSISLSFHARFHFLIRFSRMIAGSISAWTSNQTRRL